MLHNLPTNGKDQIIVLREDCLFETCCWNFREDPRFTLVDLEFIRLIPIHKLFSTPYTLKCIPYRFHIHAYAKRWVASTKRKRWVAVQLYNINRGVLTTFKCLRVKHHKTFYKNLTSFEYTQNFYLWESEM